MSTNSCIIVKVRKGDIGTKKSFNTNTLGEVEEAKWSDGPYSEDCKDRARPVKIGSDYIAIYCHWDGFPSSVGAALKNGFNSYEKALNLVLGGSCSYIESDKVLRYSTRKELTTTWASIKPTQAKDVNRLLERYCVPYSYLYTEENGWQVNDNNGEGFKDF